MDRLYALSERGFDALLRAYERGLDVVLQISLHHALRVLRHLALSVYLFVIIPKGFFPQQDIGLLTGISEAAQETRPPAMMRHQQALGEIVLKRSRRRPRRECSWAGTGNAPNNGRMFITLKPREERPRMPIRSSRGCAPQLDKVDGARLFLQAAQDVRVGGRASRTQFQYTLQRLRYRAAQRVGAEDARQAQELCRSCATSPPISRPKARR